ncbi:MAG: Multi-sensor hybrid histidine kinase [Limisphaerales bacterium]|nr:MAG: Multi-sensor hybrid histidine kinase [Limisphaerales bacterium]TXT48387.1 MAG: multi-sensor hybrid histidine kinase [Limisphaerales bacterium]
MDSPFRPNQEAAWLRLAVRAANVGLWDWEPDSERAYFSPEWKRQVGCGDHEVAGSFAEWRSRLHPDDVEHALATLHGYLARPWEEYQDEFRFRHRDGSYRWILAQGAMVTGAAGRPDRFVGAHLDITERRRAEEALRSSERFARSTVDALSAHLAILDEAGTILAVNRAWREFAAANPPVLANKGEGANYLAVCERAQGPGCEGAIEVAAGVRAVLRGELPEFTLEYPCHAPDEPRWFTIRVTRFPGSGPVRVVISHENITGRKLTEAALCRTQNWAADIINSVEGVVWEADADTFAFTFVSQRAEQLLGYPVSRWLEDRAFWKGKLHPEDQQWAVEYCLTETRRRQSHQFEYRMLAADGRVVWLKDFVTVVMEGERVAKLRGIMVDITDRKRAEKALIEAEAKYRSIFENAVDGIFQTTPDGRFLAANPAMATIFGYASPAELMAERTDIARQGYADPAQRDEFKRLLTTHGSVQGFEYEALRRDGSRVWVSESARAVRDDAGGIVCYEGSVKDISERKRTTLALTRTSELLERTGEIALIGGWELDLRTKTVFWSQQTCRIHEVEPSVAPALDQAIQFYAPEARPVIQAAVQAGIDHGTPWDLELPLVTAKGRPVWVRAQGSAVTEAGKVVKLQGAFQDITERKRIEQSLRANEEKFQAFFEASPDAIIVATRTGIIHTINRQAEQLFGYARAELAGQAIETLMPARFQPGHVAQRESYIRNPHIRPMSESRDLYARRKDGSEFPADISLSPITTAEGLMVISTIRDITTRKQAEEQLRQAEAKYRAIFDNTVEGIVQTNPSGRIITANPTLARLLGYDTPEQLLAAGINMDRDVHVNPGDRTSLLRRARVSGRDFIQCQFRRRDGQLIWVALNLRAVRDEHGEPRYFEGTCVDITERRQLEEQLRQSQKMEAVGQLAGGIAHDFNNILGAILGNAELLRLLPAGSRETGECLEAVLTASRRARDLVRQILAFSRRHESQREPVQLHRVVREVLALLRATVPATVEFRSNITAAPTVLANASEIHQVTMNLCTNAWHALPGGGVIQVELAEAEVGEALARQQPDLRPGRYVRLTVADNGCGMDEATLARIFEPFFTTKPVGEGTGLGLAVVHGIVKSHDGGIVVSSEPGRGTTFALYFPVFEAEVVEPPATPQPVPRGRGEHILFVDDEEPLVRMGRAALERLGYRVTAMSSPVEALALFSANPAQFDLVITDLNMPGLNGPELARKLVAVRPDIRLVLTSGYSAAVTDEVAHELGFRELLPKPYDLRTLGETTHRALNETALTRRP